MTTGDYNKRMSKLKAEAKKYDAYARVYDAFKGDRTETIYRLEHLIAKYHPRARALLDLACGTGSIAHGLGGKFTITGLDNAPSMLRIAKHKLPHMQLVHADMTNFRLNQTFDGVYCIHNSMNHLLTFKEWEDTFLSVASHLRPGGIFIFDSNPKEKLDSMAKSGPTLWQAGQDYVIVQVIKDNRTPAHYRWDVEVLERRPGGAFKTHHEPITVSTYSFDQISQALSKHFKIADHFVVDRASKPEDFGRAYFICIKK